jgi:site-specific DNA recombinase
MGEKRMKIFGYVRVSSEFQKLKNNSISSQISYIEDYCERYDYELIRIFKDEGLSGKTTNRKGLMDLFQNLKEEEIDCLVVYSLSRFSRKLRDVLDFIEKLNKHNIKFISIKENFDSDDIVGKMMMGILGSVNEFEVNLLGDRIRDVKQFKKTQNEVYTGPILFGMYRRGNKLVKNRSEISILKLIIGLREESKFSYKKISDYLNENGYLSKNKKMWYGNSVRSVYMNGMIDKL